MQKVKLSGRLPLNIDRNLGFALDQLLNEIGVTINDLVDDVMPRANHSAALTADTLVRTGKSIYRGFTVTVITAVGAIDIRDATSAGTGVVIDTIPAATAAGTRVEKQVGRICEVGLYVDFAAGTTGTIVVDYE